MNFEEFVRRNLEHEEHRTDMKSSFFLLIEIEAARHYFKKWRRIPDKDYKRIVMV